MQALHPLQPAILTVHAAGGRAMMEDAKAAAPSGTKVVGVTVLTSLDEDDLASIGVGGDPHAQVARLSALAREAGLDGVVCAGPEVEAAKKAWPDGFFVVPGVRPADGLGRRPEEGGDAAPGARRGRLDPRRRPPDHPGRRPRSRRPRHRRDAVRLGVPRSGIQSAARLERVLPQRLNPQSRRPLWTSRLPGLSAAPRRPHMSWLTRVRNSIPFLPKRETPDNLWHKCPECEAMVFTKE